MDISDQNFTPDFNRTVTILLPVYHDFSSSKQSLTNC